MFQDFRSALIDQICFSHNQIELVFPGFDKKNLSRWQKKGYIIKLRNGLYTFPEFVDKPGFNYYFANRIYQPSYISLHYALNFYGVIPEVIKRITSVSTKKSMQFNNTAGVFVYQTVKPNIFFGYEIKEFDQVGVNIACIEKAIIDFFYLFPFYNSTEEIENLRFDNDILKNDVKLDKLNDYLLIINQKSLNQRISLMKKVYGL